MLGQRYITAIIGIPFAVLVVYLGGFPFFAIISILSLIGMQEFFKMFLSSKLGFLRCFTYLAGIILQTAIFLKLDFIPPLLLLLFLIGIIFFIIQFRRANLQDFALTVLGFFYVYGLFAYLILLRNSTPEGMWWVFLSLALIWSNDTGAYFTGRYFGKHKLHELVSPKKTIEGAIGGILLATIVAFLAGIFLPFLSYQEAFFLGILTSIIGILGDLWESGLKRVAGVKDSGSLLPGHGGVLDRFDSLLFAAPVVYYYIHGLIIN